MERGTLPILGRPPFAIARRVAARRVSPSGLITMAIDDLMSPGRSIPRSAIGGTVPRTPWPPSCRATSGVRTSCYDHTPGIRPSHARGTSDDALPTPRELGGRRNHGTSTGRQGTAALSVQNPPPGSTGIERFERSRQCDQRQGDHPRHCRGTYAYASVHNWPCREEWSCRLPAITLKSLLIPV